MPGRAVGPGRDRLNAITFSFSLTITDFETGDTGDVVNLLPYIGDFVDFDYTINPFASGVLQLEQSGTDVVLYFDQDGTGGFSPRELWITFQMNTRIDVARTNTPMVATMFQTLKP